MLCPKCRQPYAGSRGVLAYLDNKYTLCYDFLDDYNALSKFTEEDTQRRTQSALNAFWNRIRVPPLRSSSTLPPPPPPIVKEQMCSRGFRVIVSPAGERLTPITLFKDGKSGGLPAFLQGLLFPRPRLMNSSSWNG